MHASQKIIRTIILLFVLIEGSVIAQGQLNVDENREYGVHLVNETGQVIFVFLADSGENESVCNDECGKVWLPVVASAELDVSEELDSSLLGSLERADGTLQVTYGGWPLYLSAKDGPSGVLEQGIDGEWLPLSISGQPVAPMPDEITDSAGVGDELTDYLARGRELYEVSARPTPCASCHGVEGEGGSAPPIEGSRLVEISRRLLIRIVHGGQIMPSYGSTMTDSDIAAIANYVRKSFGFDLDPVSEEEVKEVR